MNILPNDVRNIPLIDMSMNNLLTDALLLGLFLGQRMYYFDREIIFNEGLLSKAVIDSKGAHDIYQHLHRKKITHVILRLDHL